MLQSPSGLSERISGVLSAEKQMAVFKHVENLVSINALYAFPFNIQRQSEHQDVHAPFTAIPSSSTSVYLTWDKSFTAHEVRNDEEKQQQCRKRVHEWNDIFRFDPSHMRRVNNPLVALTIVQGLKDAWCEITKGRRMAFLHWLVYRQGHFWMILSSVIWRQKKNSRYHMEIDFFLYFPSIMPIKYSTT